MAIIKITEADRLKSKTAESAWYTLRITECKMQASKSGKSLNFWTTFSIASGPLAGKELPICFNTEMDSGSILGSAQFKPYHEFVKLIEMVIGGPAPDNYDTDDLLDKTVDGKVDTEIANGSPMNVINSFLPVGAGQNQKVPY